MSDFLDFIAIMILAVVGAVAVGMALYGIVWLVSVEPVFGIILVTALVASMVGWAIYRTSQWW